mgnify:CR=1 FL=1
MNTSHQSELPHYPSTLRNRKFILEVLKIYLPDNGFILETASGSGEHVEYFGEQCPDIDWLPSDKSDYLFWAIKKRILDKKNILEPIKINLEDPQPLCEEVRCDGIINTNMTHISPWRATEGLFRLAKKVLKHNGFILIYGPFKIRGKHISVSNKRFHEKLFEEDPLWGVRDMEQVVELAKDRGFLFLKMHDMPANNKSLVFKFEKSDQQF